MKKVLCSLWLAVILIVPACARQEYASSQTFRPPIEGIQWGMMPEEVMEILSLSGECIQSGDENVTTLICSDRKVFGQNADVEMVFDIQAEMGLQYMEVCFTDLSKELLVEALNQTYGDYSAIDKEKVPCQWQSEKIEDMPDDVQEIFRQILADSLERDGGQGVFSMESVWNTIKTQPLVTVTLHDNILIYHAANMAGYLKFCGDSESEKNPGL